jgi:hypothetical protein
MALLSQKVTIQCHALKDFLQRNYTFLQDNIFKKLLCQSKVFVNAVSAYCVWTHGNVYKTPRRLLLTKMMIPELAKAIL